MSFGTTVFTFWPVSKQKTASYYCCIYIYIYILFLLFDQHPNRKLRVIIVVFIDIYCFYFLTSIQTENCESLLLYIYRYILFLLFDQHPNRKLPVIIVINIFILHGSIYNDQSTWISYTYILGVSWYFLIQRLCVNKTKFFSI